MANQIYRGNSEQKLYNLTNNFIGGLNTVDVDEVVSPNEFRELVNVDLSRFGMLQNRKGFALKKAISEYLEPTGVLNKDILYVSVLSDDDGMFDILNSYQDKSSFEDVYGNNVSFKKLSILFVVNDVNPSKVSFKVWNLFTFYEMSHYQIVTEYINYLDVLGTTKNSTITGLKPVQLGNLIYFSTGDFIKNGNQLVEINLNTDTFRIIDNNQHYYETTPYDVETEGYNLLAANPILNVKQQGTLQNIRGITLIKKEGSNYYALDNIPTDGQFTALVMHTGDIPVSNIAVRVYYYNTLGTLVEYEQNKDYIMTFNDYVRDSENKKVDGLLTFNFDFAKIERRDVPIQIEFNVVDPSDIITYQTFSTPTGLNEYYNFTISTQNDDVVGADAPYFYDNDVSPFEYRLYKKASNSAYTYEDLGRLYVTPQVPQSPGDFTYYLTAAGEVKKYYGTIFLRQTHTYFDEDYYYQYNGSTWIRNIGETYFTEEDYNNATFKLQVRDNFDGLTIPGYPNTTTGIVNFLKNITTVPNLQKRIPSNVVGVIKIDGIPYVWKQTFEGDASDFEEYDATSNAISNFTLVTQFGVTENLEPIKGLNLTNVKITSMNNTLVIYSGNTLWYSVEGNPNYFPYKNYVQLPLIGNDEIVSINYFRGTYMLFTKERIYRISGYFPDITVTLVNDSIGCLDAGSIRSFNNTLVFLTYDGLYRLKQNYYMDGLENVEKIDDKINNLFKRTGKFESILYKENYLLFVENESFDTLKYYYNINLPNGYHPFTVDKYAIKPDNLFKVNGEMYSIKNGSFYKYDEGYTDFLPKEMVYTSDNIKESTYHVTVRTINMMLGLPTHSKKFKNLIIKTKADIAMPLYITVLIDDYIHSTPMQYIATLSEDGQIEYREILGRTDITTTGEQTSNLLLGDTVELIDENQVLGNFTLGNSKLGVNNTTTHKMNISGKGQYVQFLIDQFTPSEFSILDIGLQYKVGKVRGN